ncbi:MAG: Crp/Fnr family transcriptional regulator [Haliea sp.]|uniref:Crp/Fnr family transcriptional regulator n=1 Tax=Haliea sp. TaxID=1932666 RepID=UPI0032EEA4FB
MPFFNWIDELPEADRQVVQARMKVVCYDHGELIYRKGQQGSAFYQVKAGQVRLCNVSRSGKQLLYRVFREGECFGDVSLIDGLPRYHNATAFGRCELWVMHKTDFDLLRQSSPAMNAKLLEFMCFRSRIMFEYFEDASMLSLEKRLARRLIELDDNGKPIILSQTDLAQMMGASRQAIGNLLHEWQREQLISLHYRKLNVLNSDLLLAITET